jgi:hypothetical protein
VTEHLKLEEQRLLEPFEEMMLSKDQLDSSEKANNLKGEEVQLLSVARKRSESNLEV